MSVQPPTECSMFFHEGVRCFVDKVSYDFRSSTGRIDMPEGSCTDMAGAIDLIRGIDPEARRIETFAGGKPDTSYLRDVKGDRWRAVMIDHDGTLRQGAPAHFPRRRKADS